MHLRLYMLKNLLFLVLGLPTANVMAEWTMVGENNELAKYVDISTLRKTGSKVKIWELTDFKTLQTSGRYKYYSIKILYEYDCKEEQLRSTAFVQYAQNMGDGQVIYSANDPTRPWQPVVPGSSGRTIWEVVCESN